MEWNYGEYDGITTAEIERRQPSWNLWRDGCPDGESPDQVLDRAGRFLARVAGAESGPVIAFSHGHFIRALAIAFLDLPALSGPSLSLETAAVSVLRSADRSRFLQLWNDTGHLPGTAT